MTEQPDISISKPAPVVLFVYNRPQHTRRTLEALRRNHLADRSLLYVFADGPKQGADQEQLDAIHDTRAVIGEADWCKEVILINRLENMQLEDNVIDGITEVVNRHGKVIVLEDDLVTSPYFLQYCNEGLLLYEDMKQVFSINTFMFPIDFDCAPSTFLAPYATSSWGWATWADRWDLFVREPKDTGIIENNDVLMNRFNFGTINILNMLKYLNTWDARWYYTAFIHNAMGLFPTCSLVENIGFDGSGTHAADNSLKQDPYNLPIPHRRQSVIDLEKYARFHNYFQSPPLSTAQRIKNAIKNLLGGQGIFKLFLAGTFLIKH